MKNTISKTINKIKRFLAIKSLMVLTIFSSVSYAQDLPGILVKEKIIIHYEDGHGCMTQTRAATKEEALYTTNECGAVKYSLTKKGKRFTIFEKNESKWANTFQYKIQHSYMDEAQGDKRYTFLTTDGSSIVYVPETPSGPLLILDLIGQELIHFVHE